MGKKRKYVPLVLLTLFLCWQVDSLLHLILVPHTVCEHGEVVDSHGEAGHPHHNNSSNNKPNHEGCRVLSALTTVETKVSDASCPITVARFTKSKNSYLPLEDLSVCKTEIFEISPCNSPPSIG